jgi:hypothetical protein
MSDPYTSRLTIELELVAAMYPEQVHYEARSRDFKYTEQSALLHLRLPETYPECGLPDVIEAHDAFKNDIRDRVKAAIHALGLTEGEEALDAIMAAFQSIIEESHTIESHLHTDTSSSNAVSHKAKSMPNKTVIIWLHHLLALSKRKLALSPSPSVSGITKPGYPGVMIFSGPATAVTEHVNILKAENWQAFQVRYEGEERWEFVHGETVKELETMSEVVAAIGARRKEEFLEAVGIK